LGLALADFWRDLRSSDDLRGSRIFVFCEVNNARFSDFPSDKFYDISTQRRQSVSPCKVWEQNFAHFIIRVGFSKRTQKLLKNFPGLATSDQTVVNPQ